MKKRIAILFAVSCLLLAGCVPKVKEITIEDCRIENITPHGLRSVDVKLALTVNNPGVGFTISNISGTVFKEGKEFVLFTVEPITLRNKCVETYPLDAGLTLSDSVSIMELLALAMNHDINQFTVNLHARGTLKSGIGKDVDMNDVPLSRLVKAIR